MLGGFFATCAVEPAAAIVIGVIHPRVRSTGVSVLSLFQNLFGWATGPFVAARCGMLSDWKWRWHSPMGCILGALSFLAARRSHSGEYEG